MSNEVLPEASFCSFRTFFILEIWAAARPTVHTCRQRIEKSVLPRQLHSNTLTATATCWQLQQHNCVEMFYEPGFGSSVVVLMRSPRAVAGWQSIQLPAAGCSWSTVQCSRDNPQWKCSERLRVPPPAASHNHTWCWALSAGEWHVNNR